jgi:hypothetical protein
MPLQVQLPPKKEPISKGRKAKTDNKDVNAPTITKSIIYANILRAQRLCSRKSLSNASKLSKL